MKKVKVIFVAAIIGLSFAVSSCSEEIVLPDGETTEQETHDGKDD